MESSKILINLPEGAARKLGRVFEPIRYGHQRSFSCRCLFQINEVSSFEFPVSDRIACDGILVHPCLGSWSVQESVGLLALYGNLASPTIRRILPLLIIHLLHYSLSRISCGWTQHYRLLQTTSRPLIGVDQQTQSPFTIEPTLSFVCI